MCRCGLNHRGYEVQLCRIELAKRAHATVLPEKIEAVVAVPGKPVTGNAAANQATVTGNAKRQAELKSKRIAQGLIRVESWIHPDDARAIKEPAKRLNEQRAVS